MTKSKVKIRWQMGTDYGSFPQQTVTDVHVDDEGFAFGLWKGRLVGAFHVDNLVWHVIAWL